MDDFGRMLIVPGKLKFGGKLWEKTGQKRFEKRLGKRRQSSDGPLHPIRQGGLLRCFRIQTKYYSFRGSGMC